MIKNQLIEGLFCMNIKGICMYFNLQLQSRIVSSGKEKSREEVIAEQRSDKKGRDRNKRMFGALLGTLQRFKQEETKLKDKVNVCLAIEPFKFKVLTSS